MSVDLIGPGSNAANVTTVRPAEDRVLGALDTYFKSCSSLTAGDGTRVLAGWLNQTTAMLRQVIRQAGVTEDNTDDQMIWKAIQTKSPGRLLRTTVYTNVAGVQYVQVNGGAATTVGASTFTSHPQTAFQIVEIVGGGGASGGAPATDASHWSMGYAGNNGAFGLAYVPGVLSSITVSVAAAAAGVSGGTGGSGPTSSFGSLVTAPGGGGGATGSTITAAMAGVIGAVSGPCTASGGAKLLKNNWGGGPTSLGQILPTLSVILAPIGAGGYGTNNAYAYNQCPGGGSGGQVNSPSQGAQTGNQGAPGIISVYEYSG